MVLSVLLVLALAELELETTVKTVKLLSAESKGLHPHRCMISREKVAKESVRVEESPSCPWRWQSPKARHHRSSCGKRRRARTKSRSKRRSGP